MRRVAFPFRVAAVMTLIGSLGVSLSLAAPPRVVTSSPPDSATVERYGPAYRYPQAGWIVLHIEGDPYGVAAISTIKAAALSRDRRLRRGPGPAAAATPRPTPPGSRCGPWSTPSSSAATTPNTLRR